MFSTIIATLNKLPLYTESIFKLKMCNVFTKKEEEHLLSKVLKLLRI